MHKSTNNPRRKFIKQSAIFGTILPFAPELLAKSQLKNEYSKPIKISLFSKHLQFLDYQDLAIVSRDLGLDGIELPVRNKGHVEPSMVKSDLPKAVNALRKQGLISNMIVTNITEVNKENTTVIETAADNGIEYYRMGSLSYPNSGVSMKDTLKHYNHHMRELEVLNKINGIVGCYQNHAGTKVGANIWEVYQLLEGTSNESIGAQFDIRHATVDGGLNWPNSVNLIKDRIKSIVIKDFRWEKIDGKWKVLNTPLGEGMVDFNSYFKMLKKNNIHVPVSLHCEYDLFGAEHGRRDVPKKHHMQIYKSIEKDVAQLRKWWDEA